MADKELKIKISGDASQFGRESQKAVSALNEVKGAAQGLLAGFTGGIIGGGLAGAITGVVNLVASQIVAARQLVAEARNLEVNPRFLRGARAVSEYLTGSESVIPGAIENAAKKRSDAVFGDDNATAALGRLGLNAGGIAGMSKEELFEALVKAFREGNDSRERRAALGEFFGQAAADALLPYIVGRGGNQLNFGNMIASQGVHPWLQGPTMNTLSPREHIDPLYRGDVEPTSAFGLGDEVKARRIRDETAQRDKANRRSELSTEEQILDLTKQRANVLKQIEATGDVVQKAKLDAERSALDTELIRLKREADTGAGPKVPALATFIPAADELAQRGLFVGGAGMTAVPQILHVHTQKLERVINLLEAQYRANEANWGK
jgi:hypothetical protein